MLSQKRGGSALHGGCIQRRLKTVHEFSLEYIGRVRVPNPVHIGLLPAAETGVESCLRFFKRQGSYILRQVMAQLCQHISAVYGIFAFERAYLHPCVYACIRAARAGNFRFRADYAAQRALHFSLYAAVTAA